MRLLISSAYRLTRPLFVAAVRFVKFRVTTPHSNSLPIGREDKTITIRSTMRLRVAFGLFGLSENSSFPSTLRAWFAFAHSSPPTGVTKKKLGLCCLGLQKYAGAIYCTLQFYKGLFHLF